MASQSIIDNHDDDVCKKKTEELLKGLGLPPGLLPMEAIEEFGYNRAVGFMWVIQRKKQGPQLKAIKQLVSYAAEVTAFVEPRRLKKITG